MLNIIKFYLVVILKNDLKLNIRKKHYQSVMDKILFWMNYMSSLGNIKINYWIILETSSRWVDNASK